MAGGRLRTLQVSRGILAAKAANDVVFSFPTHCQCNLDDPHRPKVQETLAAVSWTIIFLLVLLPARPIGFVW
jgi:hypothetical protein